jgi:hypothetical protein
LEDTMDQEVINWIGLYGEAYKKTPLLEGLRGIMIFNHGLDACFFQRVGYLES